MSTFKVGEVVEVFGLVNHPQFNGCAGAICKFTYYAGSMLNRLPPGRCAFVVLPDCGPRLFYLHNLRKKRPPKREIDTVVGWSDCAWQPSQVRA